MNYGTVTLSPEGERIAFIVIKDSAYNRLAVRDLRTGEIRSLDGTEGAIFPFWSPNGRWLAFFADGKLKKIQPQGGPVQIIADAPAGRGGSWSTQGVILFAPDIFDPLLMVPDGGGLPKPATQMGGEKLTHRNPHFLDDGNHFLYSEREVGVASFGRISAGSITESGHRVIVEKGSNPQVADGTLFFVRDGNLLAQSFDTESLSVEGPVRPVASAIEYNNPRNIGNFSVSSAGTLVYRKRSMRQTQLAWFDRKGRELETVGEPAYFTGEPAISADGSRVALVRADPSDATKDIWVMDLGRELLTRSTFVALSGDMAATLSPSGERVAVYGGGPTWIQSASDGASRENFAWEGTDNFWVWDWSSDGRYVIGTVQRIETGFDIAYVDLQEPAVLGILAESRFFEGRPRFAPDGSWVAYASDETGRMEIYVTSFPDGDRKHQVSSWGNTPRWSSDGKGLFYWSLEGVVFVPIRSDDSLAIGEPELLLPSTDSAVSIVGTPIAFDGTRFLGLRYASDPAPEPFRLIRNWKNALKE